MHLLRRTIRVSRHGMTIVELLVVLGIMAVLLGIAATAVKNGTRGKKQREAARQVNAFIATAQARAAEAGRPIGFEIVRNVTDANGDNMIDAANDIGLSNAALAMYVIETPPIYAGDDIDAVMTVAVSGSTVTLTNDTGGFAAADGFLMQNNIVKARLNYRGRTYENVSVAKVNPLELELSFNIPDGDNTIFTGMGAVPVQITLPPIRSSATPLQLPSDMCIDLTCSGVGNAGNQFANWNSGTHDSIKVLFSPNGTIDSVSNVDGIWVRPLGNVHILVGKYDHAVDALAVMGMDPLDDINLNTAGKPSLSYIDYLRPTDPDLETNLADASAMWVSVNFQTGQITTTRNKRIDDTFMQGITSMTPAEQNASLLAESRDFARNVLIVKGQGDE
ncbi:Tfp pilus assembly protein FimT/FimU [Blastopirellula marina]|uniref:Prepilin-type N-terminal cleavage/methylation domain-containing protein n=1 Tax=Blastopirellula marina TaxID=124 RepID=A0A2S8GD95_9BACT|nr:prepilin-type N-terminal cleavage/methylation domain-containing protein [Blastopirellula marina]PQO42280.1 hypothetical protein C5Y93_28480 [Blastopirellula marina]